MLFVQGTALRDFDNRNIQHAPFDYFLIVVFHVMIISLGVIACRVNIC